jgi:hypothetical protein
MGGDAIKRYRAIASRCRAAGSSNELSLTSVFPARKIAPAWPAIGRAGNAIRTRLIPNVWFSSTKPGSSLARLRTNMAPLRGRGARRPSAASRAFLTATGRRQPLWPHCAATGLTRHASLTARSMARAVPRLYRASSRPDAAARRHCRARQSGKPQKQSRTRRHSRRWSQPNIPAGLLARSEPDRSFGGLGRSSPS